MENSNEKIIEYPGVGNVTFLKKKGLRRVSIMVKPFKGVVVSLPFSVSYANAENFVKQKLDWILKAKEKMAKMEARKTIFSEESDFKTRKRVLTFVRHSPENMVINASILKKEIRISIPEGVDVEHPSVQEMAIMAIERALTLEAKEILPTKTQQLASKFGFVYSDVAVKKTRSRWGSCSSANNINLSVFLLNLPDSLIDYVILHELCHTIEKNHGPNFWKLLDKVTGGNAKQLAKEMKSYSTRYF